MYYGGIIKEKTGDGYEGYPARGDEAPGLCDRAD